MSNSPTTSTVSSPASVRVAIRVRPMSAQEKQQGGNNNNKEFITYIPNEPQIVAGQKHSYTFDHIFQPFTDQNTIYETSVLPLVNKFLEGYNATVLAYGQTSSGKTYTMGIGLGSTLQKENEGIVPRFINTLFDHLHHKKKVNHHHQVSVSFLELHNEDLIDLLLTCSSYTLKKENQPMVVIRQDIQGNICWSGVREEIVTSPQQLLSLLEKGSVARVTASTDMNISSSRSHAIFSIQLKQTISDDQGNDKTITSKFHFVDLAGSERLKRTNAVGDRAKEGISINSGLLALGNVISALADESKRASHIPYRDSKLTRLLQDSLGGNSQTLMLACVSPSWTNHKETLNTLKYANRARNIRNRVVINQQIEESSSPMHQDHIKKLKHQIGKLRQELTENDEFLVAVNHEMDTLKHQVECMNQTIENLVKELSQVKYQRDCYQLQLEEASSNQNHPHQQDKKEDTSAPNIAEVYAKTIEELRVQVNTLTLQNKHHHKVNPPSLPPPPQQRQQPIRNKSLQASLKSSSKDSTIDSFNRKKKKHSVRMGSKRLSHQRSINSLRRRQQNNSGRTIIAIGSQQQQRDFKHKKQEWSLFVQQEKGKLEKDLTFVKTMKTKILPNNSEEIQNNFREVIQYSESLFHQPNLFYVSEPKNGSDKQIPKSDNSNNNNNFVELLQRFDECLNRQEAMLQTIPQLYPNQRHSMNNNNNNDQQQQQNHNNINSLKRQHERDMTDLKKQYDQQIKKQQHELQAMKRQYQQLILSSEKARNQHNATLLSMKQKLEQLTKEKKKLIKKSKQEADRSRDRLRQVERQLTKLERQENKANQLKKKIEQELHSQKQINKHAKEDIVHLGSQLSSVALLIQKVLQSNNSTHHQQQHQFKKKSPSPASSSKVLSAEDCSLLVKAIACARVRGHLAIQKHVMGSSLRRKNMKVATLQKRLSQKKQLIQKAIDLYVHASISMQFYEQLIQKRDHLQIEQQNLLAEYDIVINESDENLKQTIEKRINQVATEYNQICTQLQQIQLNKKQPQPPSPTTPTAANIEINNGEDGDDDHAWIDDAPFWNSEDTEVAYENLLTLLRTLEPDETRYVLEIMVHQVVQFETVYNQKEKEKVEEEKEDRKVIQFKPTMYYIQEKATEWEGKEFQYQDNYITISSHSHHEKKEVISLEPIMNPPPDRRSSLPIPCRKVCK